MDIDNLDFYYEDCVIGGPGSFVVTIKDRDKFKEAIRDQAAARGRGPHAGAPGRAGGGSKSRGCTCTDRREDLAGPLGTVGGGLRRCHSALCAWNRATAVSTCGVWRNWSTGVTPSIS